METLIALFAILYTESVVNYIFSNYRSLLIITKHDLFIFDFDYKTFLSPISTKFLIFPI